MSDQIVQARLDDATAKLLARLRLRTGLSDSALVRAGLARLDDELPPTMRRKIRGVGEFASGQPDLGSNKRHLAGFGKK